MTRCAARCGRWPGLSAPGRGARTPDDIAAENLRLRQEQMQKRARAPRRKPVAGAGTGVPAGLRNGWPAHGHPREHRSEEPRAAASGNPIIGQRADIVDRNGRLLATNFETNALYAQPREMVDAAHAARELAGIFPDLDAETLFADFTGDRRFLWIRRQISPEQMQAVHDIGEPGLLFGPREMRLYPNGPIAAHILGGASYGREGVSAAEVIGVAGIERYLDDVLRDPANEGRPLALSLDLTVQAAMERVLQGGMTLMNARGAAGIIMDIETGEIFGLASLPDFDPNNRPVS